MKTNITLPEFQSINNIVKNIGADNMISRIPDANPDSKESLLYAAKVNEADVLLPKDPTYEGLTAFYQGKDLNEPKEPETSQKQLYTANEDQKLANPSAGYQKPIQTPEISASPSPDATISPSPDVTGYPSPDATASPYPDISASPVPSYSQSGANEQP